MTHDEGAEPQVVEIALPFTGRWKVENSPLRRVPSHGTNLLGSRYAIDFVGVDDRDRTAPSAGWHAAFATEPPGLFFGFGRPILAPVTGQVMAVHEGEEDHVARRSPLALLSYALGQASRLRQGLGAVGGNYVILSPPHSEVFVGLMHLQAGSIRVSAGQEVSEGEVLARCGNSGNSTQPHVHVQAMDRLDPWGCQRGAHADHAFSREAPSGAPVRPSRGHDARRRFDSEAPSIGREAEPPMRILENQAMDHSVCHTA